MGRIALFILPVLMVNQAWGGEVSAKGILVAVGGGTTTVEIVDKTLELAGGNSARVVIIAEANRENGPDSLAMWRRTSARQVDLIDVSQREASQQLVREANLIWFPGGLQGVFMNGLSGSGLEEIIRERYRDGAVIGGTSAGAAVMSKLMIGGRTDLDSLKAGSAPYLRMEGLGLWPEAIIDQHFLHKARFNRLTIAVIEHPQLLGIGIDEETAVIVRGPEFEVFGNQNVTVVDGRRSTREQLVKDEPAAARDLRVHVLRSGMKFNFHE